MSEQDWADKIALEFKNYKPGPNTQEFTFALAQTLRDAKHAGRLEARKIEWPSLKELSKAIKEHRNKDDSHFELCAWLKEYVESRRR